MHDQKRVELKLVNQYIIPFKGLQEGEHTFEFHFNQEFFDEHDVLDAKSGNILATIILNKKPTILSLSTRFKGYLTVRCDRCLEYFDYSIRSQYDLIIKFGENTSESTDEIWVIDPTAHELELEQYLYECVSLSLPIQRIHADDQDGKSACDPEMLKQLEQHSSRNNNAEEVDPRWNALKNLSNDTK